MVREQLFHQFLRPLKGIGLPINYNIEDAPKYESEIAFDRNKSKFLFSIEENEGQKDYKWITISRAKEVIQVSDNYTIDADDYVILVDGSNVSELTITLPVASDAINNVYHIKRINGGNNKVFIATQNNELIDNYSDKLLIAYQYTNIAVVSNGTQWYII